MEWVAWIIFFGGIGGIGFGTWAVFWAQRRVEQAWAWREAFREQFKELEAERQMLSKMASRFKAAIEQLPDEARMALRVMPKLPEGLPGTAQCPMCGAVVPMPGGIRKEN